MADKIFMSLFYILPIGGASYTLFRYCLGQSVVWRNSSINKEIVKSAKTKMILSFIAAMAAMTLGLLWLYMVWIPSIQFPLVVKIIFFILMIPFMCCLAALGGLGKAVQAGTGSVTGVLKGLSSMVSDSYGDKNNKDGKA